MKQDPTFDPDVPEYDPLTDYEPPYRPERARAALDHMYLTIPSYRAWWDKELADLATTAQRWKAEANAEPQMRLAIPWFCRWMFLEKTIEHYEALKAQIKPT